MRACPDGGVEADLQGVGQVDQLLLVFGHLGGQRQKSLLIFTAGTKTSS